jgi:putative oxidoreductase
VLGGVIGALFVGHGAQKLLGKFGGHGLEGTGQFFEGALGLKPGKVHAGAAGAAEMGGGALLAAGVATPVAATALHGTMATAIWTVHKDKGVWVSDGGYEYNVVLMAAVFALTAEREGLATALATLAAGVAGSAALLNVAREAPQGSAPSEDDAQEAPAGGEDDVDAQLLNATA